MTGFFAETLIVLNSYVEITSGRANFQQGFVTTCEDSGYKGKTEAERGFWSGA